MSMSEFLESEINRIPHPPVRDTVRTCLNAFVSGLDNAIASAMDERVIGAESVSIAIVDEAKTYMQGLVANFTDMPSSAKEEPKTATAEPSAPAPAPVVAPENTDPAPAPVGAADTQTGSEAGPVPTNPLDPGTPAETPPAAIDTENPQTPNPSGAPQTPPQAPEPGATSDPQNPAS